MGDKRTPTSCERCQGRKIKCQGPVPGPCKACSRANQKCVLSRSKKTRPFYQITNEQFSLILDILNIHEPGINLDLGSLMATKEKLLATKSRDAIAKQQFSPDTSSPGPSDIVMDFTIHSMSENSDVGSSVQSGPLPQLQQPVERTHIPEESMDVSPEMATLNGDINVVLDESGFHKFVGPIGDPSFNLAALEWLTPQDEKVRIYRIDHKTTAGDCSEHMPSGVPIPQSSPWESTPFLPSQDVVNRCAKRFFEEIQSPLWVMAEDRFYTQLDQCYNCKSKVESSWLCFLYALLSLTAPTNNKTASSKGDQNRSETLSSEQYFALSMNLLPKIIQYPDVNGVRGLVVLCLALQRKRTMTLMYLLVGLAVRIAQGLGLHLDTPALTHKSLEWQHMRRLWWTVYELENHACLLYGAVPSITDTNCSMSLPLENLVPPGLGVPVGYLSYSTSLTVLTSQVCQLLSPRLYKQDAQVSARSFCSLLQTFKNWKDGIPSYLHYNAPSAPVHRRSVAILHLNYWTAQIYICRHFLLFYATRKAMLEENKTTFFAQMANSCINAAEEIILILRDMTASGSLSDLSFFDTNYLLKAAIIFKLANRVRENTSDIENFNCCIGLLEKMSNMEWPSEVIARMRLLSKHSQPPHDSNMAHMAMEPCNGNTRQPQGDSLDNMGLGSEENWHSFDYSNLTMNGFLPANADILAWGSLIGWDMGSFDMPQDDLV